MAARPRTLPAAAAPVLVGTAYAATLGTFKPLTFVATLLGALLIQIGTNLSNDYSDARRGADTEDRLGPVRVTAGGLVPPKQVLIATYVAFGLAVLVGIYLIVTAGWQLLLVGIASILAGVLYTGGPRPYGYEGLGEVFVFLFFGVVAVTGTFFAQREELTWESFVLAVPVGLLATAILMVNNIRDLETDRRAGKKTLAVRLGRPRARIGYALLVYVAFLTAPLAWAFGGEHLTPWLLLPWLALPMAAPIVRDRAQPRRRAVAQRRARPHRHAAARVLRPALGRAAALALMVSSRVRTRPVRAARAAAGGLGRAARARDPARAPRAARRPDGEGEAAPLEPYDGVSIGARARRARRLRGGAAPRSSRPPTCSPPARPSATSRRRWRRSTSRCGTTRRGARGTPLAKLIHPLAADEVAVNATIGAEDRAGAAAAAAHGGRGTASAA